MDPELLQKENVENGMLKNGHVDEKTSTHTHKSMKHSTTRFPFLDFSIIVVFVYLFFGVVII